MNHEGIRTDTTTAVERMPRLAEWRLAEARLRAYVDGRMHPTRMRAYVSEPFETVQSF
jgi:hypothetical protein